MASITELLHQISNPNVSASERVQVRCQLAKEFEKTGNHEAALRALDHLWPAFGQPPNLDGLDQRTSAELLLRIGVLTGWIGSSKLIEGSQKVAKTRIAESIASFKSLHDVKKVAEAQIELAFCFTREGGFDGARELYAEALSELDEQDGDLRALAVLRSAIVELRTNRVHAAFNILTTAVTLFEASSNRILTGCFHNELAKILKNLGVSENRPDYVRRALKEYAAASFYFEQAGHARYQGVVENNLAVLFLYLEHFAEAHEHLDRAQALYTQLNDRFHLAGVEESRARVLLAEGSLPKATKTVNNAIQAFERGDRPSSLAEALTTQGIALSRLGRHEQARTTFERALTVAEQAGDMKSAGLGAITFFEQLYEHLTDEELCSILESARRFLKDTQDSSLLNRLTECACRVVSIIHTGHPDWTTFSLNETLRRHEARFIKMALEDSGGSVTRAASLLRLSGHQTLSFILNTRHQQLLKERTPIKPRRQRVFKMVSGK